MTELNKEIFDKMMEEMTKGLPKSPFQDLFSPRPMEIKVPESEPDFTQFRLMSRMWGIPIYTSNHIPPVVEVKVRGIASKIKPNTRRPLYRKVEIKKQVAYAVKGMGIISPPGYFASM